MVHQLGITSLYCSFAFELCSQEGTLLQVNRYNEWTENRTDTIQK
jgi:hypothetical protein